MLAIVSKGGVGMAEMRKALLLEDQPLLSWELEDLIRDAALAQPYAVSSCAAATSWLEQHSPDVAVIDIFVSDGDTSEVAKMLCARGVPFIVHSACDRSDARVNAIFCKGIWVPKLSSSQALLQELSQCLANAATHATGV